MDKALDRKITPSSLLRFSLPSIISMVVMNIFSSVDGVFVARYVGTDALSAVNLIMPIILCGGAVGFMLGTGGSALVAKKMGEGKNAEARRNFSLLLAVTLVLSMVLSVAGLVFIKPLIRVLGANTDALFAMCYAYMQPLLYLLPFALLGFFFQLFFIAAGKPGLGMAVTVAGGVINIVLDYLLVAVYAMGVRGASIATCVGYSVPAVFGVVYFLVRRGGSLHLVRPKWDFAVVVKAATNGASEMVTMLASGVVAFAMNNTLIRIAGADGVAASSIILYVQGLLSALYVGYGSGISPIISFNYGRRDTKNLQTIFAVSLRVIALASAAALALSLVLAQPLVGIFATAGTPVYDMAVRGFRIYALGFLFMGFNSFSSAMFTAFNNGRVSAILSFFRTLVFILVLVLTLPLIWGVTGVWVATPAAELLAVFMTVYCLKKYSPVYKYA